MSFGGRCGACLASFFLFYWTVDFFSGLPFEIFLALTNCKISLTDLCCSRVTPYLLRSVSLQVCTILYKNGTLENFTSWLSRLGIAIENEHTKKARCVCRVETNSCLRGWFVEEKKELSSNIN